MAFDNSTEYAKIFTQNLDLLASQELTTGWMDANAGQVIYNGGNEIKIPQMALDGLSNYDRKAGYADGAIDFKYQTHPIKYDRGRRFLIDDMDVDETNFTLTAGSVLAEFERLAVVPEVDAIRIAGVAKKAKLEQAVTDNALESFKDAVVKVRDKGYGGQLVSHVSYDFLNKLELQFAGQLGSETFSINGVDTQLPSLDGVALIATTSDKMNTDITVSEDGWTPAGEKIDFLIAPVNSAIGIMKHNIKRVFSPEENQHEDGWIIPFRVYHDVIVPDNQAELIVVGKSGE